MVSYMCLGFFKHANDFEYPLGNPYYATMYDTIMTQSWHNYDTTYDAIYDTIHFHLGFVMEVRFVC